MFVVSNWIERLINIGRTSHIEIQHIYWSTIRARFEFHVLDCDNVWTDFQQDPGFAESVQYSDFNDLPFITLRNVDNNLINYPQFRFQLFGCQDIFHIIPQPRLLTVSHVKLTNLKFRDVHNQMFPEIPVRDPRFYISMSKQGDDILLERVPYDSPLRYPLTGIEPESFEFFYQAKFFQFYQNLGATKRSLLTKWLTGIRLCLLPYATPQQILTSQVIRYDPHLTAMARLYLRALFQMKISKNLAHAQRFLNAIKSSTTFDHSDLHSEDIERLYEMYRTAEGQVGEQPAVPDVDRSIFGMLLNLLTDSFTSIWQLLSTAGSSFQTLMSNIATWLPNLIEEYTAPIRSFLKMLKLTLSALALVLFCWLIHKLIVSVGHMSGCFSTLHSVFTRFWTLITGDETDYDVDLEGSDELAHKSMSPEADGQGGIHTLGYLGLLFSFVTSFSYKESKEFLNTVGALSRSKGILDDLTLFGKDVINWVSFKLTKKYYFLDNECQRKCRERHARAAELLVDVPDVARKASEDQKWCDAMSLRIMKFCKSYHLLMTTKTNYHEFKSMYDHLNHIRVIIRQHAPRSSRPRAVVTICLLGTDPGCGKNMSGNALTAAIYLSLQQYFKTTDPAVKTFSTPWEEDKIFTKPRTSPYWDGYNEFKFALLIDEFLNARDPVTRATEVMEMMQLTDGYPVPLDMSAVGDKGSFFTSHFLNIITTPITDWNDTGICQPGAPARRIDILLRPHRKAGLTLESGPDDVTTYYSCHAIDPTWDTFTPKWIDHNPQCQHSYPIRSYNGEYMLPTGEVTFYQVVSAVVDRYINAEKYANPQSLVKNFDVSRVIASLTRCKLCFSDPCRCAELAERPKQFAPPSSFKPDIRSKDRKQQQSQPKRTAAEAAENLRLLEELGPEDYVKTLKRNARANDHDGREKYSYRGGILRGSRASNMFPVVSHADFEEINSTYVVISNPKDNETKADEIIEIPPDTEGQMFQTYVSQVKDYFSDSTSTSSAVPEPLKDKSLAMYPKFRDALRQNVFSADFNAVYSDLTSNCAYTSMDYWIRLISPTSPATDIDPFSLGLFAYLHAPLELQALCRNTLNEVLADPDCSLRQLIDIALPLIESFTPESDPATRERSAHAFIRYATYSDAINYANLAEYDPAMNIAFRFAYAFGHALLAYHWSSDLSSTSSLRSRLQQATVIDYYNQYYAPTYYAMLKDWIHQFMTVACLKWADFKTFCSDKYTTTARFFKHGIRVTWNELPSKLYSGVVNLGHWYLGLTRTMQIAVAVGIVVAPAAIRYGYNRLSEPTKYQVDVSCPGQNDYLRMPKVRRQVPVRSAEGHVDYQKAPRMKRPIPARSALGQNCQDKIPDFLRCVPVNEIEYDVDEPLGEIVFGDCPYLRNARCFAECNADYGAALTVEGKTLTCFGIKEPRECQIHTDSDQVAKFRHAREVSIYEDESCMIHYVHVSGKYQIVPMSHDGELNWYLYKDGDFYLLVPPPESAGQAGTMTDMAKFKVRSIANNMFKADLVSANGRITTGYMFSPGGRYFTCPQHQWNCANLVGVPHANPVSELRIYYHDIGPPLCFSRSEFTVTPLSDHRDGVVLEVQSKILNMLPSLKNRLIEKGQTFERAGSTVCRVSRCVEGNKVNYLAFAFPAQIEPQSVPSLNIRYPTQDGETARFNAQSFLELPLAVGKFGDCSSPYVHLDSIAGTADIVGIHVSSYNGAGIITPLYKSDFPGLGGPMYDFIPESYTIPDAPGEGGKTESSFTALPGTRQMGVVLKQRNFIPTKTELVPSPIYTQLDVYLESQGKVIPVAPAPLADFYSETLDKPINVHSNTFSKLEQYGGSKPLDPFINRLLVESPDILIDGWLPLSDTKRLQLYSIAEALFSDDIENLESMPGDKSATYENKIIHRSRKDLFGRELCPNPAWKINAKGWWINPILISYVNRLVKHILDGGQVKCLADACWKDELRNLEAVEAGKTRLFCVGSFSLAVVTKMVFGDLVRQKASLFHRPSKIGIDPYRHWRLLYTYLSTHPNLFGGDCSGWDYRILCHFLYLFKYFIGTLDCSEMHRKLMLGIADSIVGVVLVYKSFLVERMAGVCSGHWMTSYFNTFCNFVAHRIVWYYNKPSDFEGEFKDHVSMVFFGDDNGGCCSAEVASWFNMNTIAHVFDLMGMGYTTPDKKDVSTPFLTFESFSFLSRTFRLDDNGHVWAPLNMDSIIGMLAYIRDPGARCSLVDQLALNVEIARRELVHHGLETFMEYECILARARTTYRLKCPWPSYSEMVQAYLSGL